MSRFHANATGHDSVKFQDNLRVLEERLSNLRAAYWSTLQKLTLVKPAADDILIQNQQMKLEIEKLQIKNDITDVTFELFKLNISAHIRDLENIIDSLEEEKWDLCSRIETLQNDARIRDVMFVGDPNVADLILQDSFPDVVEISEDGGHNDLTRSYGRFDADDFSIEDTTIQVQH